MSRLEGSLHKEMAAQTRTVLFGVAAMFAAVGGAVSGVAAYIR